MVTRSLGRRGLGRFGCLVWIVILGALAWLGMQFGQPWFRSQQYHDEMKTSVAFAEALSDSIIRVHMAFRADSLNLPIAARTVRIERTLTRITIEAKYDIVVVVPWYGPVTLHFAPKVQGPL